MIRLLLAAIFLLLSATLAEAAVCSVDSIGDLDFGNVDTIGNTPATTSATVAVSCSGVTEGTSTITMCANIGVGDVGESQGLREAASPGGGTLLFSLSGDGSVPWGSSSAPELGDPYEIDLPVSDGSASGSVTLHGTVPSGQQTAPVGDYSASFSGANVDFKYAEGSHDCSSLAAEGDATASFVVIASVPANCLLQTHDLDFGATGLIGRNIDATTTISVACAPGIDYAISIDGGGSGDPDHRVMTSGQRSVAYGLFKDAGHSDNWGMDSEATQPVSGDGTVHDSTVFGRIPPQSAAPGSYSDRVVVTIEY